MGVVMAEVDLAGVTSAYGPPHGTLKQRYTSSRGGSRERRRDRRACTLSKWPFIATRTSVATRRGRARGRCECAARRRCCLWTEPVAEDSVQCADGFSRLEPLDL